MSQNYVFGIGAIFFLAALLMFGTKSGFLPRFFHAGRTGPAILGALLVVGALLQYGPEIWDEFSSGLSSIVGIGRAAAPRDSPKDLPATRTPASAAAPPKPAKQAVQHAPAAAPVPTEVIVPEPVEVIRVAAPDEPVAVQTDSVDDPYDSGLKRAVKHAGRFLHISKKPQQ